MAVASSECTLSPRLWRERDQSEAKARPMRVLQQLMDDVFDLRREMSSHEYLNICDTLRTLHLLVEMEAKVDPASGRCIRSTRRRAVKALFLGIKALRRLESLRGARRGGARRGEATKN